MKGRKYTRNAVITRKRRLLNNRYASVDCCIFVVMGLKDHWKRYSPYFVDVWQYLVIVIIFILAAIFFL